MSTAPLKRARSNDDLGDHELKPKVHISRNCLRELRLLHLLASLLSSRAPQNRSILFQDFANISQKPRPLPICTGHLSEARTTPFSYRPHPRSIPTTLTPVESSDEDFCEVDGVEDADMHAQPLQDLPSSQTSKTSSMNVGVDEDADLDMADSQPRSSPPWQSQVTLSPPRSQPLLSIPVNPSGGRIPTPIYGHFTNDISMDTSGQNTPATAVPIIREDDEWRRRGDLPSPTSDNEHQMMSPIGETDGMMGRLNVGNETTSLPSRSAGSVNPMFLRRDGDRGSERSSRLVMGYRADCEKCRQKVPGHYSHILRY